MTANLNDCLKLYCTWNNLSKVWTDCNKKLEESLQMALQYQDTMQVCVQIVCMDLSYWLHYVFLFQAQQNSNSFYLQGLFEWLKSAELRSTEEFMLGTDLESVKGQLCDLKVSYCLYWSANSVCSNWWWSPRKNHNLGFVSGIRHQKTSACLWWLYFTSPVHVFSGIQARTLPEENRDRKPEPPLCVPALTRLGAARLRLTPVWL